MSLFGREYIQKMLRGVIEQDPVLFYWHYDSDAINFLLPEDHEEWKQELKSLKRQFHSMNIISENNRAFEFEGKKFHALVLQQKDESNEVNTPLPALGFNHMVSGLPYYFKSETTRNKVYNFLMGI